ncbi:MAG: septum formation protein Maf [Spirochaetales bacterium]|nr:septum formation protein Maf [Spirochaetales bacterium]
MDFKESPFSRRIPHIILASQSAGRLELLKEAGCLVTVKPTYIREDHTLEKTREIVALLAERKFKASFEQHTPPHIPLLAADTLVDLEGEIVGKAKDEAAARVIIGRLSGKTHTVYSAYVLYLPAQGTTLRGVEESQVTFRKIKDSEIESYLATNEWRGAAGAYRVQGAAASFIESIEGEVSTVVGLPIEAISAILEQLSF